MKEFAKALENENRIKEAIQDIHNRLEGSDLNITEKKREGSFSLSSMQFLELFRRRMNNELNDRETELAQAKEISEEKRQELVESSKAKKMLETLKSNEKKKYWEVASRRERAENDETALKQFVRNQP